MELSATLTRNEEGEPDRMIGALRDISERKSLEQKLAEAEKFESIGVMAAGLAHDFNNLLTGVIGAASLVQEMLTQDHDAYPLLDHILTAGERAATITSQMLSYAGKSIFYSERVDLGNVAREAIASVRRSLRPGAEIALNIEPEAEALGDARQLREAMINLMTNAVEATAGGGRVSLALREQDVDQASSIRFTPRNLRVEGWGLLPDVQLRSRAGEGTTAVVLLPAPPQLKPHPRRLAASSHTGEATVLVVDDEFMVAELGRVVLQKGGYKVKVAKSGPAALEVLEKEDERVSLVLLDLTMPVMSGQETPRRIREIDRDLPVIRDQRLHQGPGFVASRGGGDRGFFAEALQSKCPGGICVPPGGCRP